MDGTPENAPVRYRIDDLVLDTGTRQVLRDGSPLDVVGLTFDFLLALAEAAPSIVSYDALAERVWKGRTVAPETIVQRAKILRGALSDDARSPRYFELIRGQGYRMIADVEGLEGESDGRLTRRRRAGWMTAAVAAMVLVAIAMLAASGLLFERGEASSIAVLPFADISQAGDQQYLADGFAEEMINQLSRLDGLDVASRTESFYYRDAGGDIQAIGRKLRVSAVLEGSIRKSEETVRVTVQLIDVDSGYHLWSENYDRRLEDIFSIQDEIASAVAGALGVTLGVGDVNQFSGAGTRNYEAYEAFLQREWGKALRIDPDYAAAWGAEGLRIASTMWLHPPEQSAAIIERAYGHVARAVQLDPGSAQAHSNFAAIVYATMDWERAEQSFARSLAMRHSAYNLYHYANMMMRAGRSRYALQLHEQRENAMRIPETHIGHRTMVEIAVGNMDGARKYAAWMDDDMRRYMHLSIAFNEGTIDDIRTAIDQLPPRSSGFVELFSPMRDMLDAPDEALRFLTELAGDPNRMWPSKYENIALVAAWLGYPEFAFEVFTQELRLTTIRFGTLWYPVLADVRRLPEFKQFLRDVNLVQYWRNHGWSDFCRPYGEEDFICE